MRCDIRTKFFNKKFFKKKRNNGFVSKTRQSDLHFCFKAKIPIKITRRKSLTKSEKAVME